MISCAIMAVIWAIVVVVVLWAFETIVAAFGLTIPPPIMTLVRVLAVLLVVLMMLNCLFGGEFGGRLPTFRGVPD